MRAAGGADPAPTAGEGLASAVPPAIDVGDAPAKQMASSPVLGPATAVDLLDPNQQWVYGVVHPLLADQYRLIYVGHTSQPVTERSINNRAESHKDSPWLRYCRGLFARGLRPDVRFLPYFAEADAIAAYGLAHLLNVADAGGGRKPELTWTPDQVDDLLAGRPIADLVLEHEIGAHHWRSVS